jgi:MFS family permease
MLFFRRFPAAVWALVGIQLLTSAGFSLALPFVSLYLSRERALSMSLVGTVMLLAAFSGASGQVLGGALSDRFGRKPVLLGALAFRILVFLLLAWLMAEARPVWAIAGAYLLVRASGGLAMPPVSALTADLASATRVEGYGILRVGANLGWALGPALGGYLASLFPYAALFLCGAIATTGALLLVGGGVREHPRSSPRREGRPLVAFRDKRFAAFLLLCAPVFLVAGQLVSTLSVFTVNHLGLSEAQFGSLLTLNGLLVVGLQYPLARRIQRWPRRRALALGALLYSLGYLSFAWIRTYPLALGAIAVVTFGEMLFSPVALSVAAELAPAEKRGRYLGAFGLLEMVGWSGGAFLGGVLLDHTPSPQLLWLALSFLGFLATGLFLRRGEGLHRALQEKPAGAFDEKKGRP